MKDKLNILVAPYSNRRIDGKLNSKNYPHWRVLLGMLVKNNYVTQVVYGNEPVIQIYDQNIGSPAIDSNFSVARVNGVVEIEKLVLQHDLALCVDNYLHHMAHYLKKPAIVLFGPSDPLLFGYFENINLYAHKKYFRPMQFQTWNEWDFSPEAFVLPERVVEAVDFIKNERL